MDRTEENNKKEIDNIFDTRHKMVKGTWNGASKTTFEKETAAPKRPLDVYREASEEVKHAPKHRAAEERHRSQRPLTEEERRRRAKIAARKKRRQEINKKFLIVAAVLAVLDIFILFPAIHKSAALEGGKVRAYKLIENTEGLTIIQGKTYYFDKKGHMATGPAQVDGKDYYFDDRLGYMKTGVVKIGDNSYYYDKNGQMQTGAITYNDNQYYFDEDGKMHIGWLTMGDKTYYYDESGKKLFGMQEIEGRKCMFVGEEGYYKDVSVKPDKPMIALTFDDGPADGTSDVLDALESVGGRATFFIVGNRVQDYPDDMKRAIALGCEIGNHSWDHQYLDTLGEGSIMSEINDTNDLVEEVTGVRPKLMRLPGGRDSETVKACIRAVNMPMINWSVDTLDWSTLNTTSTIEAAVTGAYDGAIVLMHDLHASTTAGAAEIVKQLSAKGYQLVTVSEMAQARGITLTTDSQYYDFLPTKKEAATESETAGAVSADGETQTETVSADQADTDG